MREGGREKEVKERWRMRKEKGEREGGKGERECDKISYMLITR